MERSRDVRFVLWTFLLVVPILNGSPRGALAQKYDVIVVGAGLSGLTAANRVAEQGKTVIVLEASSRVGGRMFTANNSNVGYVDLGAAYVGDHHRNLQKELSRYNIKTFKSASGGDALCYRGGNVIRYQTRAPFPTQEDEQEYAHLESETARLVRQVERNPSIALSLDKVIFQQWLDETISSELVKANMRMWTRAHLCVEPSDISLLMGVFGFEGSGGLRAMNDLKFRDREFQAFGGVQQLPQKMAEDLADKVLLEEVVQGIKTDSASDVTVTTVSGKQFKASRVIIAIPPNAQQNIILDPPPSQARQQLIKNMPQGSVIKTFVYYERAYWKEQGLLGYFTCEDDDSCPVCEGTDYTKPDGSYPALVGFIAGNKVTEMSKLTKEQRRDQVAAQYAMIFNITEMNDPVHYEEYDWTSDPWARGGYAGVLKPGGFVAYGWTVALPEGLIHYAGTEAGGETESYMDGAINAGNRAAKEVLSHLGY